MRFEPPYISWLLETNCWMLLFILLKLGKFQDWVVVRFSRLCEEWYNLFYSLEAPLIKFPLGGKYYIEGSLVTIACEASGKPLPDVAWIRNGVLESSGKKAAFLKFENINRTDAGQYTCQANNSVEVTSIDTSIVVHCKYILTLIFYFWVDFIYSANPVIGISYPKLTNLLNFSASHWSKVLVGTIEFTWNHCPCYFA